MYCHIGTTTPLIPDHPVPSVGLDRRRPSCWLTGRGPVDISPDSVTTEVASGDNTLGSGKLQ